MSDDDDTDSWHENAINNTEWDFDDWGWGEPPSRIDWWRIANENGATAALDSVLEEEGWFNITPLEDGDFQVYVSIGPFCVTIKKSEMEPGEDDDGRSFAHVKVRLCDWRKDKK